MNSLADSEPLVPPETLLRYADPEEIGSVAQVWYEGLRDEPGSPWADYLARWTPNAAAKWFVDSQKRLGARFLVAEKEKTLAGMNGMIIEKRSGIGRFFTGVVVRGGSSLDQAQPFIVGKAHGVSRKRNRLARMFRK